MAWTSIGSSSVDKLNNRPSRQKVDLPLYAFQRKSFWPKAGVKGSGEDVNPLLGRRIEMHDGKGIIYEAEYSKTFVTLENHRVYHAIVVPGAAHVARTLLAARDLFGAVPVSVEDVEFIQPIVVGETETRVSHFVATKVDSDEYTFQILSKLKSDKSKMNNQGWTLHAMGRFKKSLENVSESDDLDIHEIKERSQLIRVNSEYYKFLDGMNINLGPEFQGVQEIWSGPDGTLAKIQLSHEFTAPYVMHPGLIDSCFQAPAVLYPTLEDKVPYLPFAVKKLVTNGRPISELWVHFGEMGYLDSQRKASVIDLTFFDPSGEIVAKLKDFTSVRAPQTALIREGGSELRTDWVYELGWDEQTLEQTKSEKPGNWLIFADQNGFGDELEKFVTAKGDNAIVVYSGGKVRGMRGAETAALNSEDDYANFIEAIKTSGIAIDRVAHFWSINTKGYSALDLSNVESDQLQSYGSVLNLVKSLSRTGSHGVRLGIFTEGGQTVGEEKTEVNVEQSGIWGFARVLGIEHPELACLRIDLPTSTSQSEKSALVAMVENEYRGSSECQIAYRRKSGTTMGRYVARLVQGSLATHEGEAKKILNQTSRYFVSGGLGGLGLKLAEWMVKDQGARFIALAGRRDPTPEAMVVLEDLKKLGCDVLLLKGDVAKEEDVKSMVAEMSKRGPELKGIVHAAGVLEDRLIKDQVWDSYVKVMAPKVKGAMNLERATRGSNLDFFALFSSISSLMGSAGQANYAAANGWLDGFARYLRNHGKNGVSIHWGPWAEVGMASDLVKSGYMEERGALGITPKEGMELFGAIVREGKSEMAVFPADWGKFVPNYPKGEQNFYNKVATVVSAPQASSRSNTNLSSTSDIVNKIVNAPEADRKDLMASFLQIEVAKVLGLDEKKVDVRQGLMSMGMDSLLAVEFRNKLKKLLGEEMGRSIPATLIFNHPTIEALTNFLLKEVIAVDKIPAVAVHKSKKKRISNEPIAIVGMSCRFPGDVEDLDSFWELLASGRNGISEIPKERWDVEKFYDADKQAPGKMYVRKGGFVKDIDKFDPQFFGISPKEATALDPQHRMLLELTWEAIESANESPKSLFNSKTGVFVGLMSTDFLDVLKQSSEYEELMAHVGTGAMMCAAAGRISYNFGFNGPSVSIDTACSSSLVALDQAARKLREGACDRAIVAGVSAILTPFLHSMLSKMRALSPEGYCKSFDASADGYARSEGCGVLLVKRLSDAIANGDRIWAVVKGSAVNHDGRSSSLTAPNGQAQEELIREALSDAGIAGADVSYVEAHGTGTPLGDPIEVQALGKVLKESRSKENSLVIGSVKTNFGHTEAAAGVAGIIKTVLAMNYKQIPPHLHFKKLNPNVDLDSIPAVLPLNLMEWKPINGKRIAGVSSFGITGTNAHVILEESPAPKETPQSSEAERAAHVLCLSAREVEALRNLSSRYASHLEKHVEQNLEDVCYTAGVGRSHLEERLAIVGRSREEFVSRLKKFSEAGEEVAGVIRGTLAPGAANSKVVFLFTGQGSQYPGMGKELYDNEPVFKKAIDACGRILENHLKTPLTDVLFKHDSELVNQTEYTQPCLFAIEYALSELWKSWGIVPQAVMGHSVGEYVAATVAGAITLEDGLKLISARAKMMQNLSGQGEMASLAASEAKVKEAIGTLPAAKAKLVSIAAVNGPESVVVSGYSEAVREIAKIFEGQKVKVKLLKVSQGFHSPQMDGMLDAFEKVASEVQYKKPQVRVVSNLDGNYVENFSGKYWRNHVRDAVRFSDGMQTLHHDGYRVFLEIGPHPVLINMGRDCVAEAESCGWALSLKDKRPDVVQVLEAVGTLYAHGVEIDWKEFNKNRPARRKVDLPRYAFQKISYWPTAGTGVQVFEAEFAKMPSVTLMDNLVENLSATDNNGRQKLIEKYLEKTINKILSFDSANKISPKVEFTSLGMDSIMMTDLRIKLESVFKEQIQSLPRDFIFTNSTLEKLS